MKKWIIGWLLIIPIIIPFFQPSLFPMHDNTHVVRLAELDRTIRDGGFPPRWSENLGFGYGMPLFSFYAPLPYYAGVLFHALGVSFVNAVKLLFILTFYASFMASYFLAREFWSKKTAYISALLLVYVPYRAVDVYVRGALGELYGLLFITLLILAITRFVKTKKTIHVIGMALCTAGLLLSHNIMAVIGVPLTLMYGVSLIVYTENKKVFLSLVLRLGLGLLWGLGMASFFFIPAVLEKQFTSVDELTKGGGTYSQHFVYLKQFIVPNWGYGGSIPGPSDGMSFNVGIAPFVLLGLALVFLIVRWKKNNQLARFGSIFFIGLFAGSLYLMSFHSAWIWSLIPVLKYLQFPWRLLTIAMLAGAIGGGLIIDRLPRPIVVILGIITIGLTVGLFVPNPTGSRDYPTDIPYIKQTMSAVIPDYIHPQLAPLVMSTHKDIVPSTGRFAVNAEGLFNLSVLSDKSQSFKVEIKADRPFIFTANIFDFPGWKMTVNGKPVAYSVGKQLPTMSVAVNAEKMDAFIIEGKLTETPLRLICDWISVCSIILIGLVAYGSKR